MAFSTYYIALTLTLISCLFVGGSSQLSTGFYATTCPLLRTIVRTQVLTATTLSPRAGASLIRLHFSDCFVMGCDASILLDTTATMESEKLSVANSNLIGFGIVDDIKIALELVCPGVVSCADIVTLAAEMSVSVLGGPTWTSLLGRRDGLTAYRNLADVNIPSPNMTVPQLRSNFANHGLSSTDLVALSGAHTFGRAHCSSFINRLYNSTGGSDPTMNPNLVAQLRELCQQGGDVTVLANLDRTTPNTFDKAYFTNLKNGNGLLGSDQVLFSGSASTAAIVNSFAADRTLFFNSFVTAMVKMGSIGVLTGANGEIRTSCRRVNGAASAISDTSSVAEF